MKIINKNSKEFKNFKRAVERNKLKSRATNIDYIVSVLKKNNISINNK